MVEFPWLFLACHRLPEPVPTSRLGYFVCVSRALKQCVCTRTDISAQYMAATHGQGASSLFPYLCARHCTRRLMDGKAWCHSQLLSRECYQHCRPVVCAVQQIGLRSGFSSSLLSIAGELRIVFALWFASCSRLPSPDHQCLTRAWRHARLSVLPWRRRHAMWMNGARLNVGTSAAACPLLLPGMQAELLVAVGDHACLWLSV